MARLNKPISSNDQDDSTDFNPLPDGWYEAEVEDAELKTSSSGDYTAVNVTFRIIGPTHAGRLVWNWFNYDSDTPEPQRSESMAKALRIGRAELHRLSRAVGINGDLEDTDDLLNKPLMIKLKVDAKGDKNDVKGYKPASGSRPSPGPSATKPAGAPPWLK